MVCMYRVHIPLYRYIGSTRTKLIKLQFQIRSLSCGTKVKPHVESQYNLPMIYYFTILPVLGIYVEYINNYSCTINIQSVYTRYLSSTLHI